MMQGRGSITTESLISLNVHDSLTFEGVEIAINPELFTQTSGGSNKSSRHGHHSRDSSFASTSTPFQAVPPPSPLLGSPLVTQQDDATTNNTAAAVHSARSMPMSGGESNMSVGTSGSSGYSPQININASVNLSANSNVNASIIQPGDIIEIKVWDRNQNPNQSKSPQSASGRKIHTRGNTNVSMNSVMLRGVNTTSMGINDQKHLLANAVSKLQQISSSSQEQQQFQAFQTLSKRPPLPIAPRGVPLGAATKESSSSVEPTFPIPHRTSSDAFKDLKDISSSLSISTFSHREDASTSGSSIGPGVSGLNPLTPIKSNINPNPPGLSEINKPKPTEDDNLRGLSVIQPNAPLFNQVGIGFGSVSGTPFNIEPTHSRISSLGSSASNIMDPSQINSEPKIKEDPLEKISLTHVMRKKFVAAVTEKSLSALKAGGRTQISILKKVADLYGLSSYDLITITKINKSEEAGVLANCQADFVTMTIKDQFVSRGDMLGIQKSFLGKWIYEGERLSSSDGVRGTVMDIRHGNEEFKSAFITDNTKITCRSRSARIHWLVQISSEMWDYASPYETGGGDGGACEIYFDKFITFMYRLFEEWTALEATHSLTVVFFSRTFILPRDGNKSVVNLSNYSPAVEIDVNDRRYEDYFKVVIENETQSDWETLVTKIKKAFISFPLDVGWKVTADYSRLPSFAVQGNILEAINTALNMLQLHFIDRDLHRVGNSIVVVSAGSGVFEVDKSLATITKQRMMDNGIGSDMLSLGLPPLHVAPFMLFKETQNPADNEQSADDDDFDGWKAYFEIPHWMHLSFVNYDSDGPNILHNQRSKVDDFDVEDNRPAFTISNDFIARENKGVDKVNSAEDSMEHQGLTVAQQHQRHLVLGRDFEDILEACRPRNRGDGGTSPALMAQLKLFGLLGGKSQNGAIISNIMEGDEILDKTPDEPREWNSVEFDGPSSSPSRSIHSGSIDASFTLSKGGSGSDFSAYSAHSPSSSFTNNLTAMLGRSPTASISPLKHIQIQQSSSVDMPFIDGCRGKMQKSLSHGSIQEDEIDEPPLQRDSRSNSVISSCDSGLFSTGQKKVWSIDAMKKLMDLHDSNISYSETQEVLDVESRHVVAQTNPSRSIPEIFNAPIPIDIQDNVGIGAAIRDFDGNDTIDSTIQIQVRNTRRSESTTVKTLKKSMNAASSNNLFHQGHAFSRPTSLAFSLDENSAALGLNLSNHNHLFNSPNTLNYLPLIQNNGLGDLLSSSPSRESTVPALKNIRIPSTRDRKSKSTKKIRKFNSRKAFKSAPPPSQNTRRVQRVLNPFRQEDEDGVLARRTHNSRRWSHVFPQGEIEFKRQTGPNWKSLCQPAILPVTIDVYPTPKELEDQTKYSFNHYQVNLDAMDVTYYTSRSELLIEMVRQRIVQDFQLVPQSVLARSHREVEHGSKKKHLRSNLKQFNSPVPRKIPFSTTDAGSIRHTLSMGHRIHVISSNPTSDSVDVVQYFATNANNQKYKPYKYNYNLWMPMTERYQHVSQIFQRFPEEYPWNRLDNLICGDPDKTLDSKTKYRRIAFCIIPDKCKDQKSEEAYILKAKKFLEFLEKLAKQKLDVQILSTNGRKNKMSRKKQTSQNLTHFIVHARKREKYDWFELAIGKSFDIRKTYRVIFKWLVASANKVEAHITTLQRRCTQYKLTLVSVPEMSSYSNISLNPLKRPESITVTNPDLAFTVERALVQKFGFCDDCEHIVYPRDAEKAFAVKFPVEPRGRSRKGIPAQQYIHHSGTLFVRILHDVNQSVTFVFLENRPLIGNSVQLAEIMFSVFRDVSNFVTELPMQKPVNEIT